MSAPAPASIAEAMDMVFAGLSYVAAADPTAFAAQAQAECLQAFEQADAISTAARAWFLGAFTAGQGYAEDADYSPTAWLIHRTKGDQGRRPRPPGLGPPRSSTSAGRPRPGRRDRADGFDGPRPLRVDRQAPARVPPRRR